MICLEISDTRSIKEKLGKFLNTLKLEDYDYIVPIPRRGIKTLYLIVLPETIKKKIKSVENLRLNKIQLKNKHILLFDDAIYDGRTFWNMLILFKKYKVKITSATFIASNQYLNPGENDFIDFKGIKTNSINEYRHWRDKLLHSFFLSPLPFISDQLMFKFTTNITNKDILIDFFNSLSNEGEIYLVPHYEATSIFYGTINNPKFLPRFKLLDIPYNIRNEGEIKIRFICDLENGMIYFIPLYFPAIYLDEEKSIDTNSYLNQVFKIEDLELKCLFIYYLYSFYIFSRFIKNCSTSVFKKYKMKFIEVDKTYINILIGNIAKDLIKQFNLETSLLFGEKEIQRSIIKTSNEIIDDLQNGTFQKYNSDKHILKKYQNFSPYENFMINLSKILKINDCITYSELKTIFKNGNILAADSVINRCLDFFSDIGHLDTKNKIKEVQTKFGTHRIFCRTYRWAGEFSIKEYKRFYEYLIE